MTRKFVTFVPFAGRLRGENRLDDLPGLPAVRGVDQSDADILAGDRPSVECINKTELPVPGDGLELNPTLPAVGSAVEVAAKSPAVVVPQEQQTGCGGGQFPPGQSAPRLVVR